jgi:putative aminopeptidase FrvX
MNREQFMSLEPSKKADELNVFIDAGKSQKEAMAEIGVSPKDLMMMQVFFSKSEGRFAANAVGGYSNFHSDNTGEAPK